MMSILQALLSSRGGPMTISFSGNVIEYFDKILEKSIGLGASDIHIQPRAEESLVRVRVDGDLVNLSSIPLGYHQELIARIKILSDMDIAERRLPQDGRMSYNDSIDLRISTLAVSGGETAIIRILNNQKSDLRLNDLSFSVSTTSALESFMMNNSGMFISSGPTGSGKSTTLYAILQELKKENVNIITIEDPVEYKLEGAQQIQVNNAIGMTFSKGLRSILRSDPDIIMVGEIRDSETAQIAVRAAITGHLVLTSLHTTDAFTSIIRLIDMGVEPYLIASALSCIQSQRLIKKLCPNCSESYQPSERHLALIKDILGNNTWDFKKPKGCSQCLGGYKGRQVISEVFTMDQDIMRLTKEKADLREFRECAYKKGFKSMLEDGLERASQGQVYIDDVLRAVLSLG